MEIVMSFVGDFIGDVFGGITGAKQAGQAAERAGQVQAGAAEAGIAEQRRQFDKLIEIMAPYVAVGVPAIEAMRPFEEAGRAQIPILEQFAAVGPEALRQERELAGLAGPEAQRAAISRLEGSPEFQALTRQGEEALLQRASATGGLRGGNIQAALAQFRPQMLQQQIETQLGRLGGFAGVGGAASERLFGTGLGVSTNLLKTGQASAAGQAAAGLESAGAIGDLLAQAGAARAGGIMGRGGVARQTFGDILSIGKTAAGFF